MNMWYKKPAEIFEEALPLGNGRLGAMIFGGLSHDRIILNEDTLWAGRPGDQTVPGAPAALAAVRAALKAGNLPEAEELAKAIQGQFSESYLPAGNLLLNFCHPGAVMNYRRELDIDKGVATVSYRAADTTFTRTAFVSFPDQVIVLRFSADSSAAISMGGHFNSLLMGRQQCDQNTDLIYSGAAPTVVDPPYFARCSIRQLDAQGRSGMRFQVRLRPVCLGGTITLSDAGFWINAADSVELRISIATSFNGFDHDPVSNGVDEVARSRRFLDAAKGCSFAELRQRHEQDFTRLSRRCRLELGTAPDDDIDTLSRIQAFARQPAPALAALYFNFSRYLAISCSRPGSVAANLQGIWNEQLQPPWSSNFTTNINAQMNYWPIETCNLTECHEPLFDLIDAIRAGGSDVAHANYGCRGWCCHHNSDIWGTAVAVGHFGQGSPRWSCWPMGGAWLCQHLMEHYRFTLDQEFLRHRAWPVLSEAAKFCLDWLVEWNVAGQTWLVTAPSTSPENGYLAEDAKVYSVSIASTMDMTIIRELFQNLQEAAAVLDISDPVLAEINAALPRLYPFQIGAKGQLQEYYRDYAEPEPHHRHLSHLYGMYPAALIQTGRDAELASAVQRSMELRGDDATGWSFGWKTCLWARLLDGDHAWQIIRMALRLVPGHAATSYAGGGGVYANLFDAHPPFQIDGNFGVTAGIAEMLLQSHVRVDEANEGLGSFEIHLLPALPKAWSDGQVAGLRARGGVTVDISWRHGQILECTLQATQAGTYNLRYRGQCVPTTFDAAETRTINFQGRDAIA